MGTVHVGGLAYAGDPNDPDVDVEALAGGFVWRYDEAKQEVRCVRARRGQVQWSDLPEEMIVTAFDRAEAKLTAGSLYLILARQVGRSTKPSYGHLRDLEAARLAAETWAQR